MMMPVPSGPPAPARSVPGVVPRTVPRSPTGSVPGIVPRVPPEAPAPAAEREARAPGPVPPVVPRIGVDHRAPRSEHRGDVLGFHPHLVAHDHDVVKRRVVGRHVVEGRTVAGIDVARRHLVGRRLESAQAARVSAFIVVGQHALVRICVRRAVFVIAILRGSGLRLGDPRLPFGPAGFGGSALRLGLGLLPAGDLRAVMHGVEIVGSIPRRGVVSRRAACEACGQDDGSE